VKNSFSVYLHCNENPIYVFLCWELRCLRPIFISVSDLFISRRILLAPILFFMFFTLRHVKKIKVFYKTKMFLILAIFKERYDHCWPFHYTEFKQYRVYTKYNEIE
jgi:hypothetical protein